MADGKSLAWLLTSEVDCLVLLSGGGKTLSCLAELACDAAAQSGLTEMSVDDHDLKPKLQAAWLPIWLRC